MNARNISDSRCKRLSLIIAGILFVVTLAVVLISIPMSDEDVFADDGGKCGDNLTWYYTESTGELRIEGIGQMENYGSYMAPWSYYRTSIKTLSLMNGPTSIGSGAFRGCTSITSVTIPNSVIFIGSDAFYGCTSLTSVTIPNSVTNIGSSAFEKCISLTSITIPDSVKYIGKREFYGCTSLTSIMISDSVTSIGDYAFYGCTSLTSITIPDSVISIGNHVFEGCTSLSSATIGNSVTDIVRTFFGCTSLSSVTIGNSVTTIHGAFYGCTSLSSLIIPDSVKYIGEDAFYGCTSLSSLIIPDSVKNISEDAFYGCISLTSITIPDSVMFIGDRAFFECTSLAFVSIGNSVESIGEHAFEGCTSISSITIPDSVKYIRDRAFFECTSLAFVSIGNSVESIGEYAFYGCISLSSVTIGNSMMEIGNYAFWRCYSLFEVINYSNLDIRKGSSTYGYVACCAKNVLKSVEDSTIEVIDGKFIIGKSEGINYLLKYIGKYSAVTLPENVKGEDYEIHRYAFYRCASIVSITITDSITCIGDYAFSGCSSLVFTIIGNSVDSIGDCAFSECTSLASVTIGYSVTSIGWGAFEKCYSLFEVINLSSLDITKGSVYYGSVAYYAMNIFTSPEDSNIEIIDDRYIFGRSENINYLVKYVGKDSIVMLPETLKGGDYEIHNYVFYGCTLLTSITIPDSVTSIGNYVFSGCTSIVSVTIGDSVASIRSNAFSECTSLLSITFGKGLTYMGQSVFDQHTFYDIDAITVLQPTVNNLKGKTFVGMTVDKMIRQPSFNHVTYDIVGGSEEAPIQVDVFEGSDFIVSPYAGIKQGYTFIGWSYDDTAYVPGDVITMGASDIVLVAVWSDLQRCGDNLIWNQIGLAGELTIEGFGPMYDYTYGDCAPWHGYGVISSLYLPDGLTRIGNYAFYNCSCFKGSLNIPSSVTYIGDNAFYNCNGFTGSLNIPSSVTYIGDNAFYNCNGFTGSLVIPEGVTSIGNSVFYNCYGLTGSLTIPEGVISIGDSAFRHCYGLTGSLIIPEGVISIGYGAFCFCSGLTDINVNIDNDNYSSIDGVLYDKEKKVLIQCPAGKTTDSFVIPSTVLFIGDGAFYHCSRFTGNLTIPEGVISIGDSAFYFCYGFTGPLTIPSTVTSIGKSAFYYCYGFTGPLTISEGVTTIGAYAFYRCSKLTGPLTIPEGVTVIGDSAFEDCSGFTGSLVIPSTVITIGSFAFANCTGFTGSLVIPSTVTSIGSYAFYGCSGLTGPLTIPSTVTAIKDSVFSGCFGFTGPLTIPSTVTSIGSYAFYGCSGLTGPLTIPSTVTSIGSSAFTGLVDIKTINIYSGVRGVNTDAFGSHTFYKEDGVTKIRVDSNDFYGYTFIGETVNMMIRHELIPVSTHHVTYDLDGGSGTAPIHVDVQEGLSFIVAAYSGVKTGYYFGGWFYDDNIYQPGAEITMGTSDITLTAVWVASKYTVRFLNYDGTELQSQKMDYGSTPVYFGTTPAKDPTAQYTYIFAGWDHAIAVVTCYADYTAVYMSKVNVYIIKFVDDDGTFLKAPAEYLYGTLAKDVVKPEDPAKESTAQYKYTFAGWSPEIADVKSDATYTATYTSELNKYVIRFLNYDGSVLQSVMKEYGTMPAYSGDTPTRPADAQYAYSFSGWSPEIIVIAGATDYTAQYAKSVNSYTITWMNGDVQLEQNTVPYGTVPEYTGTEPTKASDLEHTYTFIGWNTSDGQSSAIVIPAVTGDATYYAAFTTYTNKYVVTWKYQDGSGIYETDADVPYGAAPSYDGVAPTKESTAQYTYAFAGWSTSMDQAQGTPVKDLPVVTGNATYYAAFSYSVNMYSITFVDDDGTVLKAPVEYAYGTLAKDIVRPADPTKEPTAQYTYTFAGWSPEIADVKSDATYAATYTTELNSYAITWMNGDVQLAKNTVPYGTVPVYSGTEPTKASDQEHTYTFIGWNTSDGQSSAIVIPAVTGDATYYAAFTTDTNKYTVTWKYQDGSGTYETDADVPYGAAPSYDGAAPTKESTAQYTYAFAGWSTSIGQTEGSSVADLPVVTGNATYYAAFSYSVNKYSITFVDDDGTVLKAPVEYAYGTLAKDIVKPADPTKESTAQYTYTFAGWSPEIADVKSDATYTATYSSTVNSYTISFLNYDGTTLYSVMTEYGKLPAYSGDEPTRPTDAQYTYSFSGWSPEIVTVTGAADYTAQYTSVLNKYTVRFLNYDGTVLQSEKLDYGSTPVYSGDIPTRDSDVYHTYEFSGWSPEIVIVTEKAEYTAVYKTLDREYTVSFDVDGGSVPLDDVTVTAGDDYILPVYTGVKKAMTFDGWLYGSTEYSSGDSVTVVSDMLFKAVWIDKSKHHVTYDLNGGSGTAPIQEDVIEDLTFTVAAYDGTKVGYTFGGWSYAGKTYQPGASITMGTSDITFTVVWNDKPKHSVTYDISGGSGTAPVQADVTEGLSFIVKDYDGTKAGFVFQSWSYNGLAFKAGEEIVMGTTDIVLKAVWVSSGKESIIEVGDDNAPLTSDTVKEIKDKAIADPESVAVFELDSATVKFDNAALKSLDESKAATLAAKVIPDSELPEDVKKIVAGGTVIDMSFGTNRNFNNGKVTITVPFVLAEGKSADDLKVYFIENGQIKETVDGTYDNGFMTFAVSHFSMYGIAYTEPEPAPALADSGNSMFIIIGAVVAVIVVAAIAVVVVKRKQ